MNDGYGVTKFSFGMNMLSVTVLMYVAQFTPWADFVFWMAVPLLCVTFGIGMSFTARNAYLTEKNKLLREQLFIMTQLEEVYNATTESDDESTIGY